MFRQSLLSFKNAKVDLSLQGGGGVSVIIRYPGLSWLYSLHILGGYVKSEKTMMQ